ncbi:glycosyltransferase [Roseitranquillus sediminis]|uniref:glycosyltransferase n=1 Tax=Roseitranquillus sediminis TaxID=2809051 RepID=UPI001D0C02D6|nr:glycosyltransferase [Roseitranquillus sediminis]MBM9593917.1 glycosyltransferase family 28 protein [Roseitranquillus sediminis]
MILVTVGTQLPFPRLIDAMERIAAETGERVVAQTGPVSGRGQGAWPHLDQRPTLAPAEFDALFKEARVVVAHAGIGSILSARRHRRPLVILPRRHALGEHRNDHQLATARAVAKLPGIHVAWQADELGPILARELDPAGEGGSASRDALIARLKEFIEA